MHNNIFDYDWYDIYQEIDNELFVFFIRPPRNISTLTFYLENIINKNPKYIIACESCISLFYSYTNINIIYKNNNYFDSEFYIDVQKKYSHKTQLIGITGSYGKSSVSYFCYQILSQNYKTFLSSSIGIGSNDLNTSVFTTPSYLSLQRQLYYAKAEIAVIEISSHAIDQNRIYNLKFIACIFISFAEDHIDYHGTIENYKNTKLKLRNYTNIFIVHKSINYISDIIYPNKNYYYDNNYFYINKKKFQFNIYNWQRENMLSALVLIDKANLQISESNINLPKGRMENICDHIYVDGAHTDTQVYNIISKLQGNWIFVYGASGKRIRIENNKYTSQDLNVGKFIAKYGIAIITTDNAGNIDPQSIIDEICKYDDRCISILDRFDAIKYAIKLSIEKQYKLLILGKSTETYNYIEYITHVYYYDETDLIKLIYSQSKFIN